MAATTVNSVSLKLGYSGTNFTRTYKIDGVEASALSSVAARVIEFNAGLSAVDQNIFISDDYDGTIGKLSAITAAEYRIVTTTPVEE